MRAAILALIVMASVAARPLPARAIASCYSYNGFAPTAGATLPPHARLVFFDDQGRLPDFIATINGLPVPVGVTIVASGSRTKIAVLEVRSQRTGRLRLSSRTTGPAVFTVARSVPMPTQLAVQVDRFAEQQPHTSSIETFEGVALRLPVGAPAILAHVRLRRDAAAAWTTLEVPISSMLRAPAPTIHLGDLGCTDNYPVGLLQGGVELEVSIQLVSGADVPVTGLPATVTLPPAP